MENSCSRFAINSTKVTESIVPLSIRSRSGGGGRMCGCRTKLSAILCSTVPLIVLHLDGFHVGDAFVPCPFGVVLKQCSQQRPVNLAVGVFRQAIQRKPAPRQHVMRKYGAKLFTQRDDGHVRALNRRESAADHGSFKFL